MGDTGKYALLPLKPCKRAGCVNLVRGGGYCDAHRTASRRSMRNAGVQERKESAAWHYLYSTRRWLEMRARQLLIEPFCRECAKAGERRRATDVDHIVPHRGDKSLFYDKGNLQSLCHSCHSRKTRRELGGLPPCRKD